MEETDEQVTKQSKRVNIFTNLLKDYMSADLKGHAIIINVSEGESDNEDDAVLNYASIAIKGETLDLYDYEGQENVLSEDEDLSDSGDLEVLDEDILALDDCNSRSDFVNTVGSLYKGPRMTDYHAEKILLVLSEQIEEWKLRANRVQFIESPHQCWFCYRGFGNRNDYDDHMKVHCESSGDFPCPVCKVRQPSNRLLRQHTERAHVFRFRCLRCNMTFKTSQKATKHEEWHQEQTFNCDICKMVFSNRSSCVAHMKSRHRADVTCRECRLSFASRRELADHHVQAHGVPFIQTKVANEPPLKSDEDSDSDENPPPNKFISPEDVKKFCELCSIVFATREAYNKHLIRSKNHKGSLAPKTLCQICGEQFASAHERMEHQRGHTTKSNSSMDRGMVRAAPRLHATRRNLRPLKYFCSYCSKGFAVKPTLTTHLRSHTGERPFECELCGRRFTQRCTLTQHMLAHEGLSPYLCSVCGARFRSSGNRKRHMLIHTGEAKYICEYCGKSFLSSSGRKMHVDFVHYKLPDLYSARYRERKRLEKESHKVAEVKTEKKVPNTEDTIKLEQLVSLDDIQQDVDTPIYFMDF